MQKQNLEDWLKEAAERFGEKTSKWSFVCPRCGNVQCALDFVNNGMQSGDAAQLVYQECIGRHYKNHGCDWAACGLLGTLGKGRIVVTPQGEEVEVFDFAPASEETAL